MGSQIRSRPRVMRQARLSLLVHNHGWRPAEVLWLQEVDKEMGPFLNLPSVFRLSQWGCILPAQTSSEHISTSSKCEEGSITENRVTWELGTHFPLAILTGRCGILPVLGKLWTLAGDWQVSLHCSHD